MDLQQALQFPARLSIGTAGAYYEFINQSAEIAAGTAGQASFTIKVGSGVAPNKNQYVFWALNNPTRLLFSGFILKRKVVDFDIALVEIECAPFGYWLAQASIRKTLIFDQANFPTGIAETVLANAKLTDPSFNLNYCNVAILGSLPEPKTYISPPAGTSVGQVLDDLVARFGLAGWYTETLLTDGFQVVNLTGFLFTIYLVARDYVGSAPVQNINLLRSCNPSMLGIVNAQIEDISNIYTGYQIGSSEEAIDNGGNFGDVITQNKIPAQAVADYPVRFFELLPTTTRVAASVANDQGLEVGLTEGVDYTIETLEERRYLKLMAQSLASFEFGPILASDPKQLILQETRQEGYARFDDIALINRNIASGWPGDGRFTTLEIDSSAIDDSLAASLALSKTKALDSDINAPLVSSLYGWKPFQRLAFSCPLLSIDSIDKYVSSIQINTPNNPASATPVEFSLQFAKPKTLATEILDRLVALSARQRPIVGAEPQGGGGGQNPATLTLIEGSFSTLLDSNGNLLYAVFIGTQGQGTNSSAASGFINTESQSVGAANILRIVVSASASTGGAEYTGSVQFTIALAGQGSVTKSYAFSGGVFQPGTPAVNEEIQLEFQATGNLIDIAFTGSCSFETVDNEGSINLSALLICAI